MARLACDNFHNEPIVRRNIIDKSVARFRQLIAGNLWDMKLTQWLHVLLLDHLSAGYLTIYLDILQVIYIRILSLLNLFLT